MIPSPLVWGLLLGLGSSLHCAGMCGPLGCSLMLMTGDAGAGGTVRRLVALQAGRVFSYVLLGLAFGIFGAGLQARLDLTSVHLVLQWTAASAIIWLGLSTAGLLPSLAAFDRLAAPLAYRLAGVRTALSGGGTETALVAGIVWGLTPCAMVYVALFNSLLTGTPEGGVLLMAAFGVGTLPAVIASTLALLRARAMARRPGRRTAGLLMVAAGVLAFALTVPGSPLCITA